VRWITGTRDLDDQHLLLVQSLRELEDAINAPAVDEMALTHAWYNFKDIMVSHLLAENAALRVLPPDKAKAHAEIHERAVFASRDYSFNYSDPGWERLKRIITMVRAHVHSLEEAELTKALKAAQAAGNA
jgi:hypothetical protein